MQDPVYEVTSVLRGVIQAPTATKQRQTLQQFYAPDASYDGALFNVVSGSNSRDTSVLALFQFQRCLFVPHVDVHNVGFDKESNKLFIDVTQKLRSVFLPVSLYNPTIRHVTVLFLQRGADGAFYVKRHEDYFQPQVVLGALIPGLETILLLSKRIATVFCLLFALFCRIVFRHWRPVAQANSHY